MLKIPRSDIDHAHVQANLARTRVEEMRRLVSDGWLQEAEMHLAKLDDHLRELVTYAGVTASWDPIEMPAVNGRFISAGKILSIARRLERDQLWLKTGLQDLVNIMGSDMERQVDRVRQLSDLRYKTVIAALNAPHKSDTHLFRRNAHSQR